MGPSQLKSSITNARFSSATVVNMYHFQGDDNDEESAEWQHLAMGKRTIRQQEISHAGSILLTVQLLIAINLCTLFQGYFMFCFINTNHWVIHILCRDNKNHLKMKITTTSCREK